jgi:hypothetical protein
MAIRWWPKPSAPRRHSVGRAVLMGLFWVWGLFGLIGNPFPKSPYRAGTRVLLT